MATTRRLDVEVVGSASGFLATMNRVQSGLTRFGTGLSGVNRNAQQSNRWLQAMSTTLRYAFAGRIIFGIQNAVNNLGEFKTQLGEIDALAGRLNSSGKWSGLGGQLDTVGQQALLMSNRFGVAVPEVESYMQRFYTSFKPTGTAKQNVKEMQDFVNAHLELTTMLGNRAGDPNALAGGLAGLIRAMPGGEKNAGKSAQVLSNYFAKIITSSPNLSGADIAGAAGRLASAKTLANMSIRDVLGVYGLAAETGGSPSIITRGITQLLGSSLLHPTKPASQAIYGAAGLPTDPNQLAAMGGTKVLEKLITYVQQGRQLTGGAKMNFDAIYNAFSRQESVRQFVNLLANGGVQALKDYISSLDQASNTNLAHQAVQRRLDQSLLVRMHTATTNLGISLVQGANPVLEYGLAKPVIWASTEAIKHPNVVQGVEAGAFTIGAANVLRRMGAFNRLGGAGRLGRFISGASAIERGAVSAAVSKEELPAAIAGTAGDGSRANPLWVIIAPISWQMGGPDMGGGGGGPKTPGGKGWLSKVGGWAGKLATPAALGARAAGLAAAGLSAVAIADILAVGTYPSDTPQTRKKGRDWFTLLPKHGSPLSSIGTLPSNMRTPILDAIEQSGLMKTFQQGGITKIQFEGNPKADLTIKLVDAQGRTITIQEHKGVPILPKAKTFPTAQGKAGSRKGT